MEISQGTEEKDKKRKRKGRTAAKAEAVREDAACSQTFHYEGLSPAWKQFYTIISHQVSQGE
jgi:hypothetical protein